jgi:hypothetical protein
MRCSKTAHSIKSSTQRAPAIAERNLWNVQSRLPGSVRLRAGELDHLGPSLGLVGDELAELGDRHDDKLPPPR